MLPVLRKLERDQDFLFFFLRIDFIKILAFHRSAGDCALAKFYTHIFMRWPHSNAGFEFTYIRVLVLIKNADLNQILLVIPSSSIWFIFRWNIGLGTPSSCFIQVKWKIHYRRSSNTVKLLKGTVLGKINSEYPPRQMYCTEVTLRTILGAVDLLLLEHNYYLLQLLHVHQWSRICYMQNGNDWADNFDIWLLKFCR